MRAGKKIPWKRAIFAFSDWNPTQAFTPSQSTRQSVSLGTACLDITSWARSSELDTREIVCRPHAILNLRSGTQLRNIVDKVDHERDGSEAYRHLGPQQSC